VELEWDARRGGIYIRAITSLCGGTLGMILGGLPFLQLDRTGVAINDDEDRCDNRGHNI
jgi:hypothetical protein